MCLFCFINSFIALFFVLFWFEKKINKIWSNDDEHPLSNQSSSTTTTTIIIPSTKSLIIWLISKYLVCVYVVYVSRCVCVCIQVWEMIPNFQLMKSKIINFFSIQLFGIKFSFENPEESLSLSLDGFPLIFSIVFLFTVWYISPWISLCVIISVQSYNNKQTSTRI